jgi:diguanylate cyclase (GGDEF)-like protein
LTLPEPARSRAIEGVVTAAGPAAALLRHFSPALDTILNAPTLSEDDRHQQFSTAVAELVLALARGAGAAILQLEDVQWLDDATRNVLRQIAPALPGVPLLLVATARADPAHQPALSALRSALGGALDADIRLGPLTRQGVRELLSILSGGLSIDDDTTDRLAARSEGNPFTLVQYLNSIVDAGLLSPSWGRWIVDLDALQSLDLPIGGRELVASRLDGLDAESRYLLGVAAVIGIQFTPDLVAAVSMADLPQARAVANVASARNLVERRGGGQFAFLHDQIREALTARFDEPTLRGVHERIADQLDRWPEPQTVYELAQHCRLAGFDRRPDRVVRTCTAAGRLALADHAPAEALGFLRTAAEAATDMGRQLDAAFLMMMGVAQHRSGRFHDAVQTLQLAHARSRDPMERAKILGLIARVHDSTWSTGEQAATVEQALAELGHPLPKNPFLLVLSTLWQFLLGLLVGVTRIGAGTASGSTLERYRLITSLYDAAVLANARQLCPAQSVVFTLRQLYPVNRIGRGPERARMDIAGSHLAQVIGWDRFARRLTARADRIAAASGDLRLQAYIEWLKALDRYFFGLDQGDSIRRTLTDWSRWLDPGQTGDLMLAIHWDALMRGDLAYAAELFGRRDAIVATSDQSGRMTLHATQSGLLALRGQGDAAVAHLDRMRAEKSVPLPWETIDLIYATLLTAVERNDLGATFDDAAAELDALGLHPLNFVPTQRGLFVYLAYGRVEQCRRAEGAKRPARLGQAQAALKQLRRMANTPLLRAHHSVLGASVRQVGGEPDAALHELNRTEPARRAVDAPLVMFEASRVRAHALRDLGVTKAYELTARTAVGIAKEQGWPDRARRAAAEFGVFDAEFGIPGARGGLVRSLTSGPDQDAESVALGRYRQRLAAIEQVGLAASRVVDPNKLITIALDETVRILGAERALLFPLEDARPDEETDSGRLLVPGRGRDAAGHEIDDVSGYSASLVERVRRTREPVVVTGTDEGAALGAQSVVLHGLRSVLIAPLQLEGRLLGLVYLDSRVAQGIFSEDDVGVLVAITNHIAVALETARAAQLEVAVATANRQRDMAEMMRDALAEITGRLESKPERVLRRLLATVCRLIGDDQAWLILSELDGHSVRVIGDRHRRPTIMDPDPALQRLMLANRPELASAGGPCPDLVGQTPGAVRWMSIPLMSRGDRIGILLLASADPAAYDQGRAEIATALVGQAMVAYENARLFAQVRTMATTDELTGIANRWYFFEAAGRAMDTARATGGPLAAMMIDIDHFKAVNDTHGHQVGDEVIQAVAARLTSVADDRDLVGRYGGEEFAVVLPGGETDAMAAAEQFRRAVSASTVPTRAGPLDVTVSIGVARLRGDDRDIADLLARADRSLLRAKKAGRNRVFLTRD